MTSALLFHLSPDKTATIRCVLFSQRRRWKPRSSLASEVSFDCLKNFPISHRGSKRPRLQLRRMKTAEIFECYPLFSKRWTKEFELTQFQSLPVVPFSVVDQSFHISVESNSLPTSHCVICRYWRVISKKKKKKKKKLFFPVFVAHLLVFRLFMLPR
jgi:hypothetical protein